MTLGSALYGPASWLMGIERAVRKVGYTLQVATTIEGDPGGIASALASLLDQGVDGVVISEPIDEGVGLISVDVPVLVLGAPPTFTAPQVVTARVGAGRLARAATEHLLELGHATVHHLAGPQRWYSARDRLAGWREALRAHGADEPPVVEGDWSAASGYAAGRELAGDGTVTAVFAANDDMAIGLIRAQLEAGRRVPEDISVVGFDDIPVAAYVTPRSPPCGSRSTRSRGRASRCWYRSSRAGRRASTGGRPTGRARHPRLDGATTAPTDPGRGRRAIPMPTVARTVSPPAAKSHPPSPDQRRSVHLRRHVTRGPHRSSLTSLGSTRVRAKMESHWINRRPGFRCRHGHTSTQQSPSHRRKILYLREDHIVARLADHPRLPQRDPDSTCPGRTPAQEEDHHRLRPGALHTNHRKIRAGQPARILTTPYGSPRGSGPDVRARW
ncbi:substrate-binding domain-containing protein [Micromonospora sp. M12]